MALLLLLSAGCRQLLGFEGLEPAAADATPEDSDGPTAGCRSNTDCFSQACLPDGSCAAANEVAYVAAGGAGTECTQAMPCATINDAVKTDRRVVTISGTISEPSQISIADATYVWLGDPGARLTRANNIAGALLGIKNGAVTIVGLEITNTTNGAAGIDVEEGSLILDRVKVTGCQGRGLEVNGPGEVTISRSTFAFNRLGGALLSDVRVTISNSLFVNNGLTSSTLGGLRIIDALDGSTFELNTVANNVTDATNAAQDGVSCTKPLFAHSNIVSQDSISSECAFQNSLFDSTKPPGNDNLTGFPAFLETDDASSSEFYRIGAQSDAIDRGVSSIAFDIDGQPRPAGAAPDVGADERQ